MATEYETCFLCGSETGRAGTGDDSIYSDDGRGPWCLDCYNLVERTTQELMSGPTLGARIDAMFQHYIRDDFAAPESREALIAYADAAERGVAAAVARSDATLAWINASAADTEVAMTALRAADVESEKALAAWRAITEGVVQP